jgi:hypothetical protein
MIESLVDMLFILMALGPWELSPQPDMDSHFVPRMA